ncbi:hypothetical protein GCM10009596_08790 [Arthrobacter rhombi]
MAGMRRRRRDIRAVAARRAAAIRFDWMVKKPKKLNGFTGERVEVSRNVEVTAAITTTAATSRRTEAVLRREPVLAEGGRSVLGDMGNEFDAGHDEHRCRV